MTPTLPRIAIVALLFVSAAITANAQERKKQSDRQRSQERESSSTYSGGMPSCNGGLFIIQDGGTAQCRHPDGRTCTVRSGSSGNATVGDCK